VGGIKTGLWTANSNKNDDHAFTFFMFTKNVYPNWEVTKIILYIINVIFFTITTRYIKVIAQ
jgi:hypothetical protein